VDKEITADDLQVTGDLPAELEGRWLRNGPNPIGELDRASHHWFVGSAMVHGVRLRDGRAEWYRNRWIRSEESAAHLGENPPTGPVFGTHVGAPNTNVGGFAGTTWALVEAGGMPCELTYELETKFRNDFFGTLTAGYTAHPKFDPATGELHAVCYAYPDNPDFVQYVVIGPDGRVSSTTEIAVPDMPMVHDMSLTKNYAVIYDLPITVDIELAMQSQFPFRWNPDHGARVGLMPRGGTSDQIIWCDAPMKYVFHPLNAYEDTNGDVIIDLCTYERTFSSDLKGPFGDLPPTLDRWTISPTSRKVSEQRIDDRAHEFPRHNPKVGLRQHRYGYTMLVGEDNDPTTGMTCKTDFVTGATSLHDYGPGRTGAEPIFVPRADGTDEDDGWLMTVVYDAGRDTSDLVLVDARDMSAPPVATVHLPQRVPMGFHGNWVPDSSVAP
jgi:carotenoid cleavage dioxygenase-like enzyme